MSMEKLMKDRRFQESMANIEARAWSSTCKGVEDFLGNYKAARNSWRTCALLFVHLVEHHRYIISKVIWSHFQIVLGMQATNRLSDFTWKWGTLEKAWTMGNAYDAGRLRECPGASHCKKSPKRVKKLLFCCSRSRLLRIYLRTFSFWSAFITCIIHCVYIYVDI